MKHIPNILTTIRIFLTGVFVWVFVRAIDQDHSEFWLPVIVYAVAFVTDILDGFLARTFNWITPLGKVLDPIADKLMAFAALICILAGKTVRQQNHMIYIVLFILFLLNQILTLIGGCLMLKKHRVAYADWYGKTATGFMTAGVILTLLSFPIPMIEPWNIAVLSVAVALSFIALIHYARTQLFSEQQPASETEEEKKLFDTFEKLVGTNHDLHDANADEKK